MLEENKNLRVLSEMLNCEGLKDFLKKNIEEDHTCDRWGLKKINDGLVPGSKFECPSSKR